MPRGMCRLAMPTLLVAALVAGLLAPAEASHGLPLAGHLSARAGPLRAAQELPGQPVPYEGARHAAEGTPLSYAHYPPASGMHYPRWAPWEFFEAEVHEGYWLHNLEHGGIVLLYRCDDECGARAAALRAVYDALPPSHWGHVKALATPYERMNSAVAVVAWNRIDQMDTVDAERIVRFYRAFVDQGPEDLP